MAVHTAGKAPPPEDGLEPLSADLLRAYIARAKQHDPFFPEDLTGALALCEHCAIPLQQCMPAAEGRAAVGALHYL